MEIKSAISLVGGVEVYRSVAFDDDDDMEMDSKIGASEGMPSSTRKRRKRAVEENSDDDIKDALKKDLASIQKMEAEKDDLKWEKTIWKRND